MAAAILGDVLRFLRKSCDASSSGSPSDADLLERFLTLHEEAAFTQLVQRHGPMVLGVCRRRLADAHAAEDAFQATFLVLVRRGGSIRKPGSLASWLHGVARHIACRARTRIAAIQQRERRFGAMVHKEPLDELTWQELRDVLDEEIGRLPERCRAPVVLCYLEGKSYDEAARTLGCPKSSLASRLGRARVLLRCQLGRRGITLSAGALAAALYDKASAAPLTAVLTIVTVNAAVSVACGKSGPGLSARAVALAEEAVVGWQGLRLKLALVFVALVLGIGGAGLAGQDAATDPVPGVLLDSSPALPDLQVADQKNMPPAADVFGDPLPEGAVARLGTVRFRHGAFVTKIAFALDGKVLISEGGGLGNVDVCVWDASTGRLRQRLADKTGTGSQPIATNGKALATVNGRLIDVTSGKELHRFPGAGGRVFAMSPDGQVVAGGEVNGQARIFLWDAATGKELRRLAGHSDHVTALAFSADGKIVASGSLDLTIRIWDVAMGKELRRIEGMLKPASCLTFAPGGRILAAWLDREREILLWDADTGKLQRRLSGDGDLAFAPPDGKLLASACSDGMIRLWDPATGQLVRRWAANHGGPQRLTTVAFSPDGKVLASAGMHDHGIRLWDPSTGKEFQPTAGHTGVVVSLQFAADGKTLFSSGEDNRVVQWDMSVARERRRLFGNAQDGWAWIAHALSPGGKVLAVTGSTPVQEGPRPRIEDPAIRLIDTTTGKDLLTLNNGQWVRSLCFAPDSKLIAADGKEGIRVWEAATGKEVLRLPDQRAHRSTLVFSPDAKLLAWAGDADRALHVCEIATGKEPQRWEAQREKTRLVVFAPDGKSIATATRDQVHLWSVATGRRLAQFSSRTMVESLTFSTSGRILAAGGHVWNEKIGVVELSCAIYLWEVCSGQEVRVIAAPQCAVSSLAFAPQDRTLASGGGDSTILVWDLTYRPQGGKAKDSPHLNGMDALWSDLAAEAPKADKALWALVRSADKNMPYLQERLRPAKAADAKQVARLIEELDSKSFAQRDKAARALEDLGEAAEKAIREAQAANPTLEVRQRIVQFLEKRDQAAVRQLRAIEVLEQIGTPEARQSLGMLAKTAPNPRVAEAAAAAVARLAKATN
jgi:RNA polymerase sigma factor (sigma-70 family)